MHKRVTYEKKQESNNDIHTQFILYFAVYYLYVLVSVYVRVLSSAMELPGECGTEFSRAAAGNQGFLRAVESCMALSLGALKVVVALINAQEQLSSCLRQVEQSMHLAEQVRNPPHTHTHTILNIACCVSIWEE